jgi:hypothetical protein
MNLTLLLCHKSLFFSLHLLAGDKLKHYRDCNIPKWMKSVEIAMSKRKKN